MTLTELVMYAVSTGLERAWQYSESAPNSDAVHEYFVKRMLMKLASTLNEEEELDEATIQEIDYMIDSWWAIQA